MLHICYLFYSVNSPQRKVILFSFFTFEETGAEKLKSLFALGPLDSLSGTTDRFWWSDTRTWTLNLLWSTASYRKQPPLTWAFTTSSPVKICVIYSCFLITTHSYNQVNRTSNLMVPKKKRDLPRKQGLHKVTTPGKRKENFWFSDPVPKLYEVEWKRN